jgi:hypothetical protein
MLSFRAPPFAALLSFALSACATSGPQAPSADEQLRAAIDGPLRRAGVSEACIQSLDTNALAQVNAFIQRTPRTSREVLKQQQKIRTFVGRYCPTL